MMLYIVLYEKSYGTFSYDHQNGASSQSHFYSLSSLIHITTCLENVVVDFNDLRALYALMMCLCVCMLCTDVLLN